MFSQYVNFGPLKGGQIRKTTDSLSDTFSTPVARSQNCSGLGKGEAVGSGRTTQLRLFAPILNKGLMVRDWLLLGAAPSPAS